MKILKVLFVMGGFFFLASCGGNDCVQADWIGTYTLDVEASECDASTVSNSFAVTAGSSTEEIVLDGVTYTLDNCEVGESVFGVGLQYTLDGDKINAVIGTCDAEYTRN